MHLPANQAPQGFLIAWTGPDKKRPLIDMVSYFEFYEAVRFSYNVASSVYGLRLIWWAILKFVILVSTVRVFNTIPQNHLFFKDKNTVSVLF